MFDDDSPQKIDKTNLCVQRRCPDTLFCSFLNDFEHLGTSKIVLSLQRERDFHKFHFLGSV